LHRILPCRPVEIEDDADHSDHEDQERPCPLRKLKLDAPVPIPNGRDDVSEERKAQATVAEVVMVMLDWMGSHKSTWESANGVWTMLETLVPQDAALCVFARVKSILVAHLNGRLKKIDVCPCGYTVYINCTSAAFGSHRYKNAHRTCCPRPQCGLSRKVPGITPPMSRKVRAYNRAQMGPTQL
jgi:hypothetical protein